MPRKRSEVAERLLGLTPDDKRILLTGQDEKGLDGIFIQDFVPGLDTSSTRRPFAGFDPDWITESLGLSTDGRRLVLSRPSESSA